MKLKLINPTNDKLNETLFFEVCGAKTASLKDGTAAWEVDGKILDRLAIPNFTHSADAVLPWLEKWPLTTLQSARGAGRIWIVEIMDESNRKIRHEGRDNVLARACVIAILRANGVEVEFTKSDSAPPPIASPSA